MLSRQLQTIPEPGFYMCALSTVMPINGKNLIVYNRTVEAYEDAPVIPNWLSFNKIVFTFVKTTFYSSH